jgi:hypothetical protein
MASPLQQTRFTELLKRLFNLKSRAILDGVDSMVLPVVELADPSQTEQRRLRGEELFAAAASSGSIAGQVPKFRVRNSSPNTLVVIEAISVFCGTANQVFEAFVGNSSTDLGTPVPSVIRDTRQKNAVFTTTTASAEASARVAPSAAYQFVPGTSGSYLLPLELVLGPGGDYLQIQNNTNGAVTAFFAVVWYSRQAEPSELL